jgi:hypothetical protein
MSDDQKQDPPKVPAWQIVRFVIGIILFGVLMGCAHNPMTEQSAMSAANQFAKHLGYRLADYKPPKVEGSAKENWVFSYEPKIPLTEQTFNGPFVTNRLAIVVNPQTGKARQIIYDEP